MKTTRIAVDIYLVLGLLVAICTVALIVSSCAVPTPQVVDKAPGNAPAAPQEIHPYAQDSANRVLCYRSPSGDLSCVHY